MTIAINDSVGFTASRCEDPSVSGTGTSFDRNDADGQILADWLARVRGRGIDAVIDFSRRPWHIQGLGSVLGVFEVRQDQASWLIVRSGPAWTVARCADGSVAGVSTSLADALALIDAEM